MAYVLAAPSTNKDRKREKLVRDEIEVFTGENAAGKAKKSSGQCPVPLFCSFSRLLSWAHGLALESLAN